MGSDNGRNQRMTPMAWSHPVCWAVGHPCEGRPLPESVWSRSDPSSHHLRSVGGGFGCRDVGHGQAVPRDSPGCTFSERSNVAWRHQDFGSKTDASQAKAGWGWGI